MAEAMSWKFLVALLAILMVAFLFCAGWVWVITYIDQVCQDPKHQGLIAGFSIGWVIPLACTTAAVAGAYFMADEYS